MGKKKSGVKLSQSGSTNPYASIFLNHYVILASLVIFGACFRLYNLGFNSLWLDEASTLTFARLPVWDIWLETTAGEFNPPLFYWIEHFMLVLGQSEWVLRLVPAICGILTIPAAYFLGKEFMDKEVGLITAAAVAFSPFLVYYSQEARVYSLVMLLVVLDLVFYFRALKTNSPVTWCLVGLLSALAFWAHFYALVLLIALVLYTIYYLYPVILDRLYEIIPPLMGFCTFLVWSSPLILVTLSLFTKRSATAPTYGIQGPSLLLATLQQISGSTIVMGILMVLCLVGFIQLLILDKNKALFIALVIIIAALSSDILSFVIPMLPRYLIYMSVFYFLTIAVCHYSLKRLFHHRAVYILIGVFIVLNLPALVMQSTNYTKDDWRGFAGQFSNITQPGDTVIVIPGYASQPFDYYYSNATDQTIEIPASSLEKAGSVSTNGTTFYVVTVDLAAVDSSGRIRSWLDNNTSLIGYSGNIALLRHRVI